MILKIFQKFLRNNCFVLFFLPPTGDAMSEEDMLQAAVTMSLETVRNNFKTEGKK